MLRIDLRMSNNKIFLKDGREEKNYRELNTNVMQVFEALQSYSIDGIVVVQINKRYDFAVTILALAHTGRSVLLINPTYSKIELEKILNHLNISFVITDNADLLSLSLHDTKITLISDLLQLTSLKFTNTIINFSGEIMMCTSGSTGEPKIVSRTWESIFIEIESILERISYCDNDCVFSLVPWTHALGFVLHFMLGIRVKSKLITTRSLNTPANWAKIIKKEEVTITIGIPTFYSYFLQTLNRDLKLKLALCAGATLSKDIYDKFKLFYNIPICHYYGCTEAGAVTMPFSEEECFFPSLGKPLKNVCIQIIDEKGTKLKSGEVGSVLIDSKSLAHRTWQNGKFTAMNSKYKTGDQGFLTENGELIIIGRNIQRIKVNGLTVFLGEVERVLEQHPDILEAVVIPREDGQRGTSLVAYIRSKSTIKPMNVLKLRIFCQKHLAPYKIPHTYSFVETFERDHKGQVKRKLLE